MPEQGKVDTDPTAARPATPNLDSGMASQVANLDNRKIDLYQSFHCQNQQEAPVAADLILAVLHHILVFSLFAVFAIEATLVRPGLGADGIVRLTRFDAAYGALAMAVIVVGFARVFLGLKGWEYYSGYWVFWVKVAAFALVGLLSIRPTLRFRRWLQAAKGDPAYAVPAAEIAAMRPWLHGQGFLLLAILVLAAAMARGVFY